jgi:cytoskeletal protein CcmA (bactofilin family)
VFNKPSQPPAPRAAQPNENPAGTPGAINQQDKFMAEVNPTTTRNNLASDVEIKGSIKFQHDLSIDGKIEGEVTSPNGVLVVGQNAELRGEVKTKSVTVYGRVHGNITVDERCELKANAQLHGDLKAARLVIEEGATFVGKSEVTPTSKVTQMKPEIVRQPDQQPKAVAAVR